MKTNNGSEGPWTRGPQARRACAKDALLILSVLGLAGYGLVELLTHVVTTVS